ncbi:hypothetical protein CEXT_533801 [Caerostris extrusa]|uniref:Uncharacterized protein n=1 Tax=Caerostris extrusa TaxID=172846 RepID=A0AAV4P4E4_CAEEX|nr:hypothetical protein CEXT_533801 [Caerostris extrusa]
MRISVKGSFKFQDHFRWDGKALCQTRQKRRLFILRDEGASHAVFLTEFLPTRKPNDTSQPQTLHQKLDWNSSSDAILKKPYFENLFATWSPPDMVSKQSDGMELRRVALRNRKWAKHIREILAKIAAHHWSRG